MKSMRRIFFFSVRCAKEIVRDPINLGFGLGFPFVLLLLLSAIQSNVPVSLFEIASLTPGIVVFGFSFLALFCALIVSKDRESAFLQRLYTTPLCAGEFLLGYLLPFLPIALVQSVLCYAAALCLGLAWSASIVPTILLGLPCALLYIFIGLFCGSLLGSKQVGGVCGALLTNLSAWLSGTWFDLDLVGGAFKKIADILPFSHAVALGRAALCGNYAGIFPHLWFVLSYTVLFGVLAGVFFLRQMRRQ